MKGIAASSPDDYGGQKEIRVEDQAVVGKKIRISCSSSMDSVAFTAVVTVASRTLILRDRLLGRISKATLEDSQCLEISRRSIASGAQLLDAVFVTPASKHPRAAILLCHGIGETLDRWLGVQKLLAAQGVASLVFDYAGFGRSTGSIRWMQCEKDAIAAFETLNDFVSDTPVSMLGFSLGSGIAAAVLDSVSPQKLILCSSFTSFRAAARCVGLPRALAFLAPPIWNTEESLRRRSLPILVLHSEDDRLFPTQMASNLASSCREHAKIVIVPGQQHNDPFYLPQRRYWDHVISFLVPDC
jgi:alpha-beta hydrolase superfamily lysophospholipase